VIPPVSKIAWHPCYRVVPSRFPPVSLFERVADPADLDAVFAVESLTNPRLRQEAGMLSLVPVEDRVTGPGSSPLMAPFVHLNPLGSRFSDGTYGVYYSGASLDTAIAETRYHRQRFMAATREPPLELEMRVYLANLDGELHDIRGRRDLPDVYDPDDYTAGRALGRKLRSQNSWGVAYDSVRHSGGQCAGVLRPRVLSRCRQGAHLIYAWNGHRIEAVYEKKLYAKY